MLSGLFLPTGEQVRRQMEPPAGVLERLQAIHPLLGLRYLPFQRSWAVVWYWDENDPRRRRVQSHTNGHVTPKDAHTIVCELPDDCPPDQAPGFVARHLVINPPAKMWEAVRDRVNKHNDDVEQAVMDAGLADVMNRIEISAKSLKAHFADGADETAEVGELRNDISDEELIAIARGEA